ncbi:hypothetical protein KHC23_07665 [Ancylobacter dichloromethanicus]|uniref:Uncharacterized protein n=1 Tax=Ancylobacter dichloromethanicus TaxID=518825 RepID=A0A9W6MZX0_9HYPH|nr:hypothetical protein [Ancylobacter dichloromethanicus]MBS7553523.1 hypothetical protein [Ancylobacter dichloromethanicus]GLK72581.1 hypothetical protein GCM10017643_26970 [Ancylobacter dichloromethanicus]
MGDAKRRKLSRDARPEEIFPGGHGPVQTRCVEVMKLTLDALREALPGYDFTLFAAEREELAGAGREPRFNYMSTAERADMVAVLAAFVLKNRDMLAVDEAMARKPEGSA